MQIRTSRLVLREFREADTVLMQQYWAKPLAQRFNPEFSDRDAFVTALVVNFIDEQTLQPRRRYQMAVTLAETGQFIGNCSLRINDLELGEANIGYEIDSDHWGHGYGIEAATAIVKLGFGELQLHRIWAECISENTASVRVLEKLGMRREAHFREHQFFRGRWWDTLIYAQLAHEWRSRQAD